MLGNNNNYNNGGIFSYFTKLAEKANKATNSQEAKKIRTMLLKYGIIAVVVGIAMIITGFVGFGASAMSNVNSFGGSPAFGGIMLFSVILMLGGMVLGAGSSAIKAGLAIVVVGFTTDVLDNNIYCPNCKDRVDNNEIFCNNCGYDLRAKKLCSCGTQNDVNDKFCRKCGKSVQ